jgi:hypothetical protein
MAVSDSTSVGYNMHRRLCVTNTSTYDHEADGWEKKKKGCPLAAIKNLIIV